MSWVAVAGSRSDSAARMTASSPSGSSTLNASTPTTTSAPARCTAATAPGTWAAALAWA
jgi:hypothetical protein